MNALKTLVIVALLGAVAYGVYVSITRNPRLANDTGVAPAWPGGSKAQITGPNGASPQPAGSRSMSGPPAGGIAPGGKTASPASTPPQWPVPGGNVSRGGPAARSGPADPLPPPSAPNGPAAGQRFPPPGYPAIADSPPGPSASPVHPPEDDVATTFNSFMEAIQGQLDAGRLDEALQTLSIFCEKPRLPAAQARQVHELLDQLAGTVIYSRQHLLEPPYPVQPGETLEQIAQKYNVPWQLLARINGLRGPQDLAPGQQLKVVPGPFGAIVSLDRLELTLLLDGRYAGRFPIGVGRNQPKSDGTYTVGEKVAAPFAGRADGSNVEANDPDNTLGAYWIDLGGGMGIHGTNDPRNIGRADAPGTICLGSRDIEDLFGILSVGSRVVIRR